MSSVFGRVCVNCMCDEAVIGFADVPDAIGLDPATLEWLHVIPNDMRRRTYCTGCGAIYTQGHDYSRALTHKMHEIMRGRWPVVPPFADWDETDELDERFPDNKGQDTHEFNDTA